MKYDLDWRAFFIYLLPKVIKNVVIILWLIIKAILLLLFTTFLIIGFKLYILEQIF